MIILKKYSNNKFSASIQITPSIHKKSNNDSFTPISPITFEISFVIPGKNNIPKCDTETAYLYFFYCFK